ncbi:MAG: hypothetical protein OHK0045_17290 [Raineya sp.]
MKLKVSLVLSFLIIFQSYGINHIAGGELYITRVVGNTYRIQLIYYYDALNYQDPPSNSPVPVAPSPPNVAEVSLYRKLNNVRVLQVNLPRVSSSMLTLSNDPCRTNTPPYNGLERIVYQTNVTLNPAVFTDLQGYYAVFQDYTRNTSVISNISGRIGFTAYAEFPRTNGFINSNPVFSALPTLNICNGQNISLDFSATDADGDSLVYSLVDLFDAIRTPRNPPPPVAPPPLPPIYPFPVPTVSWDANFSANNAIPSDVGQPLSINSNTGILTVNAARKGIYAFVVKCEEFRGGIKIGEVRRDIQLYVDECQSVVADPLVRIPLGSGFYQEGETLTLTADAFPENNIILPIEAVVVPDRYRVRPVRFTLVSNNFTNNNPNRITLAPTTANYDANGIARVNLRIPDCLPSGLYDFTVFASNQQCPNEGIGRLRVRLQIEARESNQPPRLRIVSSTPTGIASGSTLIVSPKDSIAINLQAASPDTRSRDSLEILVQPLNFTLSEKKMQFTAARKDITRTSAQFVWQPDCSIIAENGQEERLSVLFIAKRTRTNCFVAFDTIRVNFILKDTYSHFEEFLPPNAFSPNDDGIGDVFRLQNLSPAPPTAPDGVPNPNLPFDNCLFQFKKISIYNRWGKEVFSSTDRNFAWDGKNQTSGVYYYQIEFTNKNYKGIINLLR